MNVGHVVTRPYRLSLVAVRDVTRYLAQYGVAVAFRFRSGDHRVRFPHVPVPGVTYRPIKRVLPRVVTPPHPHVFIMAMLAQMSRTNLPPAPSAMEPRKRIPKAEGDISSVFASMANDKREILPERFVELKREIVGENGDAILASWKRLLPVVEAKVREAKELGSSIFPEVEFSDIQSNNVDAAMIERIKRTGACIIRNALSKEEVAELLANVRGYIKDNPTSKGILMNNYVDNRLPSRQATDMGIVLVAKPSPCAIASEYTYGDNVAQRGILSHSQPRGYRPHPTAHLC